MNLKLLNREDTEERAEKRPDFTEETCPKEAEETVEITAINVRVSLKRQKDSDCLQKFF